MGEVVYGVDFRKHRDLEPTLEPTLTPLERLEQLAAELARTFTAAADAAPCEVNPDPPDDNAV